MDYQIKSIGRECAGSGQPLEPGLACHSVVVEQNGQLIRLDYHPEAWEGPPEGTIAHWICRVPEPETARKAALDTDTLMAYFEQMWEDANPAREKLMYLLALMLIQKRRIRIDGSRNDADEEWLQLSGSQGEGPWEIRDQNLTEDEIERLQADLNTQLQAA